MIFLKRLTESLNIFQQAHYTNDYLKWAIEKYMIRYFFLIACLLLSIIDKHFILLGVIYVFLPLVKYKKKIVITKRMIRLIITCLIIVIPFSFNFFLFYTCILFTDIIVIVANYVNMPIEKWIYQKYVKKTKKKLDEYKGIKIAIGGSYGKTSTKHYLKEALSQKYLVHATEESYNTPMGISKSVKKLSLHDIFICEMGASKENDIEELMDIVKPDITILTSIGEQHLKTFITLENIQKEKRKMYKKLEYNKIAFVNKRVFDNTYPCQIITYGKNGDYHIENIRKDEFDVYYEELLIGHYKTKVIGEHNLENILAVIAVCDYLDVKADISSISNFEHRLNKKEYETFTLIDDSFNSNIYGAINAIRCLEDYKEKYIITPGFVELGELTNKHHEMLEEELKKHNINVLIVGKNFKMDNAKTFTHFSGAFDYFLHTHNKGAVVLIENDLPDNYLR